MDNCAGKLIRSNHRLMATYVQLMPRMVQRRMEEMESKAAANAKAAEAAALPPVTEAPLASESPVVLSPLPQGTPPVTDITPEARSSLPMPAELEIPPELNTTVSKSMTASEVSLSAAAVLTPVNEAAYPSVFNDPGKGQSLTAGLPQLQVAGGQSESTAPVFVPSKPTSPPTDVAVPTLAVPAEIPSAAGKE